MIPAKTVLRLVRYKQKDNNEIKFSDYDILNAMNEALRYIVQSQTLQNSDFLEKVVIYDEEEMNKAVAEEIKRREEEQREKEKEETESAGDENEGQDLENDKAEGDGGEDVDEDVAAEPEEPMPEFYDFVLKGAELPEDYQILVGVAYTYPPADDTMIIHGVTPAAMYPHISLHPCDITKIPNLREYKVVGDRIYCGVRRFQLAYRRTILPIADMEEGKIDLPTFCTDVVVKITGMILNNADTDVMLQAIDAATKSIIPRRRYNNMRVKMPFYV